MYLYKVPSVVASSAVPVAVHSLVQLASLLPAAAFMRWMSILKIGITLSFVPKYALQCLLRVGVLSVLANDCIYSLAAGLCLPFILKVSFSAASGVIRCWLAG